MDISANQRRDLQFRREFSAVFNGLRDNNLNLRLAMPPGRRRSGGFAGGRRPVRPDASKLAAAHR
jgi:hypothetical protein